MFFDFNCYGCQAPIKEGKQYTPDETSIPFIKGKDFCSVDCAEAWHDKAKKLCEQERPFIDPANAPKGFRVVRRGTGSKW